MITTKLSTNGQLMIPREIRKRHGWDTGTELEIEDRGDSIIVRPLSDVPTTRLSDVLGCLRWNGRPKTLKDMESSVVREARRRR